MKTTIGGQTSNGKYKWLDNATTELNGSQRVKVTVSPSELIMTIGNETSKFEREKAAAASSRPSGVGVECRRESKWAA